MNSTDYRMTMPFERPSYGGFLVWNTASHTWHAWGENGSTKDAGQARCYNKISDTVLGDDDIAVPLDVYRNVISTKIPTKHIEDTPEDDFEDLMGVRLDRHVTISMCGWDYPCEGRSVQDVFQDLLRHIREDHS